MSDSSWQEDVLRELGMRRRGLATLERDEPAASQPVVPPSPTPAAPQPPEPSPAVQPQRPAQPQPAEPMEPAHHAPMAPEQPQPAAVPSPQHQPDGVPHTPAPQPEPVAQPDPMAAPVSPDGGAAPAAPAPSADPTPSAPQPLVHAEFGPEAAIVPVVTSAAPPMPGTQAPEDGEDTSEESAQAASAPAPVQPPPPPPQQQTGGGPRVADELVRKSHHGDPLLVRVGRGVRKAVGASGSSSIKSQTEVAEMLQRPVPSFRQFAVVSVRGGAGKTTMAALLATELARHRADRVLAVDADAELGSLPLRLGVQADRSLFDLAGRQPRSFEEAAQYLARAGERLWVLSSTRGGRISGEFTFDTFQTALSAVSRYFATAVVDCGAGILTDLHQGILGSTHGLVLVTPGTVDGALSARGALEWFQNNGRHALLQRTVIAMVTHAAARW